MAKPEPTTLVIDPTPQKGELKSIGGSQSDDVNLFLLNQAVNVVRNKGLDAEAVTKQHHTTVRMMTGIGPTDELEGMLAVQLFAAHNAACEAFRQGMTADTFDIRQAKPFPSEQAEPYVCYLAGSPQPPSWQGLAKGHRRARPRT